MKHKPLFYILLISTVIKLVLLSKYAAVWWDEAVYVGMAKFLYSGGTQGLWEPLRPILWPMIIGLFKWTNILIAARVLEFLCYLGIIIFTYLIAHKLFDTKTAVFASIIVASTPTLFFYSYKSLTNVPAALMVIASAYLLINKKYLFSGLLLSLAFLIRFPMGAFLIVAGLYVMYEVYKKKAKVKNLVSFSSAFLIPVIAYLISNIVKYGDVLRPFKEAAYVIGHAQIWAYHYRASFYLSGIFKENLFYFLAIVALFLLMQTKIKKEKLLIIMLPLPALIYFSLISHQEMRFIIACFPFLAIFAASFLSNIIRQKKTFVVFIILILVQPFFIMPEYFEPKQDLSYLEKVDAEVIYTSQPIATVKSDALIVLMYYPIFNKERANELVEQMLAEDNVSKAMFLDYCELEILCNPENEECKKAKDDLVESVVENYNSKIVDEYEIEYPEKRTCKREIFTNS